MREQKYIINIPYPVTEIFRQYKPSGHVMMFSGLPCFRHDYQPSRCRRKAGLEGATEIDPIPVFDVCGSSAQ